MGMAMRSKKPNGGSGMLSGFTDVFMSVAGLSLAVILFPVRQVSFLLFCEKSRNKMCRTALGSLRN